VLTWLACIVVVAYAGLIAFLFFAQRSFLYVPDTTRPELGELARLGVREVTLNTSDGLSLLAWYRPPNEGRPVIAYFHGNGGNLLNRTARIQRFAGEGYGYLMLEYRGYGGNPGSPSEAGFYADAAAALDFLDRQGIDARRLVIYGESLGTGVAVWAATQHKAAALVLEAPFTSIPAVAQYAFPYVPARWMVRDRFDSLLRIGQVTAPILFIHGERDTIIPIHFGRELFAAAPEPKEGWFNPEAGHNDLARYGALDAMDDFLARRLR
jgi:fermentation-respiration switch protein FrsA (DUF1100 family)